VPTPPVRALVAEGEVEHFGLSGRASRLELASPNRAGDVLDRYVLGQRAGPIVPAAMSFRVAAGLSS